MLFYKTVETSSILFEVHNDQNYSLSGPHAIHGTEQANVSTGEDGNMFATGLKTCYQIREISPESIPEAGVLGIQDRLSTSSFEITQAKYLIISERDQKSVIHTKDAAQNFG